MSRRRSSFYDREFVAMKSRLLARMMAPDSETSLAMDVVIVAVEVGADILRVAEKAGFAADLILPLEGRLREAQLWNGRQVDAREWLHITNDRDRMMVIYVQAHVAMGVLKRELVDGGAAYSDRDGKELVRFPISDQSRILSRFPRPRIGFELSELQ